MTILITGASGQLGRLVLDALFERGIAPGDIRAGARQPDTLTSYAELGVNVIHLDYDDRVSVDAAVAGCDRVLLISGNEVGRRIPQHRAVVEAATAAGVALLAYTSAPKADDTSLVLAPEHRATEELVRASGVPFCMLRNNWYTDNYAPALVTAARTGTIVTSAGNGRVASATRADYAQAAAAVLAGGDHAGQVYELGGDGAWDFEELAVAFGEVLGRLVSLDQLTTDEHISRLTSQGMDPLRAGFITALDANIAAGELAVSDGSLSRLIGRPTTSLINGLRPLI